MGDVAIRVEGLGKRYKLGGRAPYMRFTEALAKAAAAPFRGLSRLAAGARDAAPDSEDSFWALKDVNFEIKKGEAVGIIGRNGAGKSTLLKILSRITEMDQGSIDIYGRVGSLLEVGTGFHPELTGRENIYLNGAILGMKRPEIKKKFDEIVDFAEVEKFLDTPVKRYSSGMYMRLAFAVAAHLEPEILVVDEVLAVGDAEFQKKCLGKMSEVAENGRTVLFVSHNLNAIEDLCEKVVFLERGSIRALSSKVRDVLREYLSSAETAGIPSAWSSGALDSSCDVFKAKRFFIGNASGELEHMPIRADEDVYVFIEGDVLRADPALNFGYAIYSEGGTCLYWTISTDTPIESWPDIEIGSLRLRSQLPRRLLNQGHYRLELAVTLHHRAWLLRPGYNAPAIALEIFGGLSESPYWMQRRDGELAPVLHWERVHFDPN